ncbi:hypothetical protein N7501_008528, partial [Penicillium viridicatum]
MANGSTYTLYNYDPSGVAAIIFVVLFGLTTFVHIFQMIRSRSWFFIPFIIGGIFEAVGYVGRYLNSRESPDWTTAPYIMQSLLLLIAPAFFAASIYMILGRSITSTGHDQLSLIRVKWLTKIFVCGDVISFLAQCAGGGFLSSAKSQSKITLGQNIIIAGLFIQIAFFGFFVVTAGVFHYRLSKCNDCSPKSVPWMKCLYVLYTASLFIMIRSIFRAIEYITGTNGPLMSTEVYLYVFDAALMFLTMIAFNIFSPKSLVTPRSAIRDIESPGSGKDLLEMRGHTVTTASNTEYNVSSARVPPPGNQGHLRLSALQVPQVPCPWQRTPQQWAWPRWLYSITSLHQPAILFHATQFCKQYGKSGFRFSSPFVFRAIIALSALHLAHIKPEFHDHYVSQAELHHNTALQMVSAILPDVNKENSQSMFVFSILTCIISCAKPRIKHYFWANSDRDIEWLNLFRGTIHILALADRSLKTGPLAPMFTIGHRRKLARDARSATATPPFLLILKQLLQDTVHDPSELQCYHHSIDDMAMSFATVDEIGSHNCETADIFIWLLRVSDQYLGYVQKRTPEAMFCVLMKEMEWAWWMQGFSVHTISGIYYILGEEHRCWLQWPMQQ